MKTPNIIFSLTIAAMAVWASGCKEETKSATEQTQEAAGSANEAVTRTADAVKETGAKVVQDVTDKAKELAAPASAKAQELIDSAKSLVGAGKFQEALDKLKEIDGEKLSLNQQTVVDALKAQIEKALGATSKTATDAAGAAGNLLKK